MNKYFLPIGFKNKKTQFHPEVFDQAKHLQWLESDDGTIWAAIINPETGEKLGFTKDEFEKLVLDEGLKLDFQKWKSLSWAVVEEDENEELCSCGMCESRDYENEDSLEKQIDEFFAEPVTGKETTH